jgi:hypothetical protein
MGRRQDADNRSAASGRRLAPEDYPEPVVGHKNAAGVESQSLDLIAAPAPCEAPSILLKRQITSHKVYKIPGGKANLAHRNRQFHKKRVVLIAASLRNHGPEQVPGGDPPLSAVSNVGQLFVCD